MFSKKISLFVVPFLTIMMIANLFAIPVYGEDYPYTEEGYLVNDGELIYLVAQANGVKFVGETSSVFSYLKAAYKYYGQFVTNLVTDLFGYVKYGVNGYLNVSKDVYNSIILFLRDYYLPHSFIDKSKVSLIALGGRPNYFFDLGSYYEIGKLEGSSKTLYRASGRNSDNNTYDCTKSGNCRFDTIGNVYIFNKGSSNYVVSTSPNAKYKFTGFNTKTGKIDEIENTLPSRGYSNYGVTVYYTITDFRRSLPIYYDGVLFSYPDLDIDTICYLFSNSLYDPNIVYDVNFNINNLHSSSNNVTITNIYYNVSTNNITINNNGTQEPIDDNVQSDVVAPTVPNVKPYDVVVDLNNIDSINKYHNDIEQNVNDFLIQFNDNLNMIDTNCYSLTSCSINGLKSVSNAINDITGYSDKGMNSDIVLLISLFLLLGILFTIL